MFSQKNDSKIVPTVLSKEKLWLSDIFVGNDTFFLVGDEENENGNFYIQQYHPLNNNYLQNWKFKELPAYIFSDGNRIIVYSNEECKSFYVSFLDNSQEDIVFGSHRQEICDLSILETENLAVSSAEDNNVKIWNLQTSHCLETIEIDDYAEHLLFPHSQVVIGWRGVPRLWIWDRKYNKFLFKKSGNTPSVVEVDENHNQLLFGEEGGLVEKRNLSNGQLIWRTELAEELGTPFFMTFFPKESVIAVGGSLGNICLLNTHSGQIQGILAGHQSYIWNAIKIGDNKLLSSGFDEYIRLWDIKKREYICLLEGHRHRILRMEMTLDRQHLLSCDRSGRVLVWNAFWNSILSTDEID